MTRRKPKDWIDKEEIGLDTCASTGERVSTNISNFHLFPAPEFGVARGGRRSVGGGRRSEEVQKQRQMSQVSQVQTLSEPNEPNTDAK